MVLVGPSGCGKSTTSVRMVAGLEKISSGTISIGGKVVNDLEPKDRGISMVFQSYALYPHMNLFNNMAFGLKLAKKPKEFISDIVGRTSKALGLDHMLERKPGALSGWPAPAGGVGPGDCAQSDGVLVRRAVVESGREDAGADALGDFAAARGVGLDDDLRNARSGGSDDDG